MLALGKDASKLALLACGRGRVGGHARLGEARRGSSSSPPAASQHSSSLDGSLSGWKGVGRAVLAAFNFFFGRTFFFSSPRQLSPGVSAMIGFSKRQGVVASRHSLFVTATNQNAPWNCDSPLPSAVICVGS